MVSDKVDISINCKDIKQAKDVMDFMNTVKYTHCLHRNDYGQISLDRHNDGKVSCAMCDSVFRIVDKNVSIYEVQDAVDKVISIIESIKLYDITNNNDMINRLCKIDLNVLRELPQLFEFAVNVYNENSVLRK